MRRMLWLLWLTGCASGSGAGAQAGGEQAAGPLTVQEVTERFRAQSVRLGRCYERERFNQAPIDRADYVASVTIGADGGAPHVTIARAAVPGLKTLEDCIRHVLAAVRFRAHQGAPMTVDVPVRAPGP